MPASNLEHIFTAIQSNDVYTIIVGALLALLGIAHLKYPNEILKFVSKVPPSAEVNLYGIDRSQVPLRQDSRIGVIFFGIGAIVIGGLWMFAAVMHHLQQVYGF